VPSRAPATHRTDQRRLNREITEMPMPESPILMNGVIAAAWSVPELPSKKTVEVSAHYLNAT